ncbi:DNA polymerase I [Pseudomonas phage vB_PseuGesM_254]|uniref:DNA polymerase I n=1 Tax=Pseudomonas phage vB_PseuGesM_254 TaxID=3092638 RepID=A0AAX4G6L8_9CAUD|nr:DNA polymerase I [Pseudomonas phage PseuGes_254]
MNKIKRLFDIEATNLLTAETVDYTVAPFKLKPGFIVHCGVIKDIDTEELFTFVGDDEIRDQMIPMLEESDVVIGHNIIGYDLLTLKAVYGMQYTVGPDTINGKPVEFYDTLVISKMLNPDRKGHSLAYFGDLIGLDKIDWRAKAIELGLIKFGEPKGAEFQTYHEEMLVYCIRDVELNVLVYHRLMEEWGMWDWSEAFETETCVMDIITRQSHRGFQFDSESALEHVRTLDTLMERCRVVVEPILPPKKPSQVQAKEFCPPKLQIKKASGEVTAVMQKWVAKHGGEVFEEDGDTPAYCIVFGKKHRIPMVQESLLKEIPARIDDTTHIKGWFVEMGWAPSAWKERDLTVDSKKAKLTTTPEYDKDGNEKPSKFEATVRRYITGTLESPFRDFRLQKLKEAMREKWSLKFMRQYPEQIIEAILEKGTGKPIKVYTNPQITVGQDKEICPLLEAMSEKFAHTREITNYLTYKHRRNSILGGGFDPDEFGEDEEPSKGYLSYVREDGRVATPADTCGAGTSRFKHRQIANIPRVSSLFGEEMRSLFGVNKLFFQMGYDFDSLEAKIEAHYCWKYDKTKTYCNALDAPKPNDIHTVTAATISAMIGANFSRSSAKNVKYGCSYGAQAARVMQIVGCTMAEAEQIFEAFWESAAPLAELKKKLTAYWKTEGQKRFILGIDGRKIMTRSEHALVNSLFQSAGVICAKRAMVLHDRKLRAEGLIVDFWVDNWLEMDYSQQMIAYHDEAQTEVSRKLVKFKMFSLEDLGYVEYADKKQKEKELDRCKGIVQQWKTQEEKTTGKVWSDISKSPKGGFFVAYTRSGELAVEAVVEAGAHYKLNVALSAGYIIGTNWGNCH